MVCPSHVFVDQHPASGRGSPDVTLWSLSGQLSSVCSLFLELLCPGPCALVLSDQGVQQTLLVSTPCAPAWTASPGASCVVQGSPSSDPSSRISVFCCMRLFVSKALFHGCILPTFGCSRCEVKSNPPYSVLSTHWSFIRHFLSQGLIWAFTGVRSKRFMWNRLGPDSSLRSRGFLEFLDGTRSRSSFSCFPFGFASYVFLRNRFSPCLCPGALLFRSLVRTQTISKGRAAFIIRTASPEFSGNLPSQERAGSPHFPTYLLV